MSVATERKNGGSWWTNVDPHEDIVLLRIASREEKVKEQVSAVRVDVEVAGVGLHVGITPAGGFLDPNPVVGELGVIDFEMVVTLYV